MKRKDVAQKTKRNKVRKIILWFPVTIFLGIIALQFSLPHQQSKGDYLTPVEIRRLPEPDSIFLYYFDKDVDDVPVIYWSFTEPYRYFRVDNVIFQIFVNRNSLFGIRTVLFVKTCDPNFLNVDGISPGQMSFVDLAEKLGTETSLFGIELSDGWHAILEKKSYCLVRK